MRNFKPIRSGWFQLYLNDELKADLWNLRVAFGSGGKKKTEPLFFISEEINESVRPSSLFALDKIDNERRNDRPGDKEIAGRPTIVRYFLSQGYGDFDDEAANSFEQDGNGSHLRKHRRMFVASNFRFIQDVKILLGSGVGSFGG